MITSLLVQTTFFVLINFFDHDEKRVRTPTPILRGYNKEVRIFRRKDFNEKISQTRLTDYTKYTVLLMSFIPQFVVNSNFSYRLTSQLVIQTHKGIRILTSYGAMIDTHFTC